MHIKTLGKQKKIDLCKQKKIAIILIATARACISSIEYCSRLENQTYFFDRHKDSETWGNYLDKIVSYEQYNGMNCCGIYARDVNLSFALFVIVLAI